MEIVAVFAAVTVTWSLLYWAASSIYNCFHPHHPPIPGEGGEGGCLTSLFLLATGIVSVVLVGSFLVWFWLLRSK